MNVVKDIFDKMDGWRNLPNYQLERRSDLFFAVYLKEVLEKKYKTKLNDDLIPEFPVHIATIYPDIHTNKSFKIDYVAFTQDYSEIFLVELKTDSSSRREKQDKYLQDAASTGLTDLIEGLKKIFQATNSKRKYFHMFKLLETVGVIELPKQLQPTVFSKNMTGVNDLIAKVKVVKQIPKCRIVYVQPTGEGENIINFKKFSSIITKYNDPITMRFAQSLDKWSDTKAGDPI
ncbi:MAG: hypothetical protein GY861_19335 [bacterium]|nr:hypothetical protein [bacterium]